jgi:O-antigen ligase
MIAAVPLARCTESLRSAVYNSGLIRPMLEEFGGVPEDKFEDSAPLNTATGYFMAITLGILSGGVTYFTSSLNILWAIFAIFAVSVVMCFPEIGVLATIFVFPFLGLLEHPTAILVALVVVDVVAYLSKVMIGKRVFRLRLVDIAVCLFAILFLMGGIITAGGIPSLKSAAVYFVLIAIYFLVVNLFNTRAWLERAVIAISIPSVLISLYGIIGYATTDFQARWLDSSMFSDISNRAVSVFENPNMLATYLVLTIPFVLIGAFNKKLSGKHRAFAFVGVVVSLACIILTWSRGAWLGLIAAIIIFSLIVYKHSLKYWLAVGLTSPIWSNLIPQNVMSRFMSIGDLADSSTYYRLYTWKGSIKMFSDFWLSGIGVGEAAFSQIYPLYAYVGIESTVHSHNLFLQTAIELGISGLIVFLIIIFLSVQKGFRGLKNTRDPIVKLFIAAALSGLVAALVHGMVDYIWYNYRVFFAFWIVVAFICAGSEVARKEKLSTDVSVSGLRERAMSLDIIFG